jgi:lysozyme
MIIPLEQLLEEIEGKRNKVYKDSAGLPTIGIGHLLTKDELTSGKIAIADRFVQYRYGLPDGDIYALFNQDVHDVQAVVKVMVTVSLSKNQETALSSLCYNIGRTAFFRSTLVNNLNIGDYNGVPFQMSRWKYAGGKIIKGLILRREREIQVWNTPD